MTGDRKVVIIITSFLNVTSITFLIVLSAYLVALFLFRTTLLSTLLEVFKLTMIGKLPSDRLDDRWLSNEKLIRFMFQVAFP